MIYRFSLYCDCEENKYKKEDIVLTSMPPQYVFSCVNCGLQTAMTQEEIDSLLITKEKIDWQLAYKYLRTQPLEMRAWSKIRGGMSYNITHIPKDFEDPHWYYMLSCGQNDKNGKLMYAGDIVRFNESGGDSVVGVISFADQSFVIDSNFITYYRWYDYSNFEVIGNIFEDLELVEEHRLDD